MALGDVAPGASDAMLFSTWSCTAQALTPTLETYSAMVRACARAHAPTRAAQWLDCMMLGQMTLDFHVVDISHGWPPSRIDSERQR